MKELPVKFDGIKVYDPRRKRAVLSNNPALVIAHIIENQAIYVGGYVAGCIDWESVASAADFYEFVIGDENGIPIK